jgi:hypothetical protein
MPVHCARQNHTLHILPYTNKVITTQTMTYPNCVLLNDRPFIEIGRHVVRRSTHDLHAPVVGLVVGLGTLEARQEAVVNVDASTLQGPTQII